jgi:hypothetical protein
MEIVILVIVLGMMALMFLPELIMGVIVIVLALWLAFPDETRTFMQDRFDRIEKILNDQENVIDK